MGQVAQEDPGRREYIRRVIASGLCHVAEDRAAVTGYVVFDYTFYPMQALLARLGYKLSGVIHDLDEGDPELVYVKYLRGRSPG